MVNVTVRRVIELVSITTQIADTVDDELIDTINRRGALPLITLLDWLGNWPVLVGNKWNQSAFDWLDTVAKMRLDQTSLALPDRSIYLEGFNNSLYSAYYKLMVDCAIKFGANNDSAHIEMMDVIKFETQLANVFILD
ncbi:Membrane metallo-endopeptidase-like 1 [Leptotrombidium deliense]|uniref:Membrane metallo-endopeptidase-like 1 n=1 Tax=Leptotrombidium deliense TaxID=299467 RepID=A0A443SJH9_9ACAR|nr:Membrane metallo-endopeptidase-like 1 [Leptotrombidium deliense]